MKNEDEQKRYISIGALARTCGIPVETLRNWERRYGFPVPVRLASGHRRYPWEVVHRLRLVRHVLEAGFKPSFAVPASAEELERVLSDVAEPGAGGSPRVDDGGLEQLRTDLVAAALRLDAPGLEALLRRAWSRLGARVFITQLVVGFLREIGDRWAAGSLHVAHEHFVSEVLQSFLAQQWRPMAERADGDRAVLATFEGELHVLGLHMAAVFLTMDGIRPLFLGANTPLGDIVVAARDGSVLAVIIGLSAASNAKEAARRLAVLREELPAAQVVAVGGNDDVIGVPGTRHIATFDDFAVWVPTLR
jgi:methanogenic corrinoid protein MtbC1